MGGDLLKFLEPFIRFAIARADDGEVDLSAMGMNDFAPYSFERQNAWILLPAISIFIVLLHLKRNHKRKKMKGTE